MGKERSVLIPRQGNSRQLVSQDRADREEQITGYFPSVFTGPGVEPDRATLAAIENITTKSNSYKIANEKLEAGADLA